MPLFHSKENESPPAIIQRMIDYMPEHYRNHKQFEYSVEYLTHREWGLALKSLIELANETEHYFSEDFWNGLADAADKMGLKEKSSYCREQLDHNKREIKNKIPFGWTVIKLDDTHFQYHISDKLKNEWATERRNKYNVWDLLNHDGVHLKSHGRGGTIYLVDKGRIAEMDFEVGANCLILYFNKVDHWAVPAKINMTADERIKIEQQLLAWSAETKNSIELC